MTSWNLITAQQKEVSSSAYSVECDCDAVHEACWDCDEDGNEEEDEDDGGEEVQHKGSRGARICVHTVTSSCLYIYMNGCMYICMNGCMHVYMYEWMYV